MLLRKLTLNRGGRDYTVMVLVKDKSFEDAVDYLLARQSATGAGVVDHGPFRLEVRPA